MIGRNLILILKGFKRTEILKFGDFIKSPYFNKQYHVTLLWDYLKEYYPSFDSDIIKKEELFKKIYGNDNYVESRIRNLCSDLKLLAEKFLMIEAVLNDKTGSGIFKLESLISKRHYSLFIKSYGEVFNKQNKVSFPDEWDSNNFLKLYNLKFAYLNAGNGNAEENEEVFKMIYEESLIFFLTVYFKNCHRILNKQRTFFKYKYSPEFFDTACKIIETNTGNLQNETYLMLHYHASLLYISYDENNFNKFYDFVLNNFHRLNKGDLTDNLIALINYCRTQSLSGKKQYEFKALELYKLLADNNIWDSNNLLRPSVYRGAVSVACNCGDFEWAENFLNKYKKIQPKEHIESNYNLCYGRLYFDKNMYDKSIMHLTKVRNEDSSYKYETDALLMKIYYETNAVEPLFSKIDSFKHWIINNKTVISDRYRQILKKMAYCIETLAKLKIKPDNFEWNKLKTKIEEDKTLVNRLWMLEKISELNRLQILSKK